MTFEGKRWRAICVRCRADFTSVRLFSTHLGVCEKPFDIQFIFDTLRVTRGETDECWLMADPRGTRTIPKFGVKPKESWRAHVIVATVTHGERPDGAYLCHLCDNKKCLNPDHLYWGTARSNAEDMWRNSRRTMSDEQKSAMISGLRASDKHRTRMTQHNKDLGAAKRGDAHWTRRSPEAKQRWVDAMTEGRRRRRSTQDSTTQEGQVI